MSIATQSVEALSPEAFATLASSPFPCAPRYGREVLCISDPLKRRPRGGQCAPAKHSRNLSLLQREFLDKCAHAFPQRSDLRWNPQTRFFCQMCYMYILTVAHKTGKREQGKMELCLRTRPALTFVRLVVPAPHACKRRFIPVFENRGFPAKFSVTYVDYGFLCETSLFLAAVLPVSETKTLPTYLVALRAWMVFRGVRKYQSLIPGWVMFLIAFSFLSSLITHADNTRDIY